MTGSVSRVSTILHPLGAALAIVAASVVVALSAGTVPAHAADEIFVRLVAPLDEPRGLCLDVPGHRDRVNVNGRMVIHTCKWGLSNRDERFDRAAVSSGELRMPDVGLCLGAEEAVSGSALRLGTCDGDALRRWTFGGGRFRIQADPSLCLTAGSEPSALTPGGRRLPSRHVARSVALEPCAPAADDRQVWRLSEDEGREP